MLTVVFPCRCKLPNWDNDTYSIQNEVHELYVNRSIPWATEEPSHIYSQCLTYKDSISYDTTGYHPISNTTVECDEWVYDKSVFRTTFTSQVMFYFKQTSSLRFDTYRICCQQKLGLHAQPHRHTGTSLKANTKYERR